MTFLESMPPEWRITVYYAITLIAVIGLAKTSSLLLWRASIREKARFLVFAPSLSCDTWIQFRRITGKYLQQLIAFLCVAAPLMAAVFLWFPTTTKCYPWWLRAYFAIIPFCLLIESIHCITRLSWAPFRLVIPPINDHPWRSRTIAEFWDRRWNRLFGDWFRQVCFRPLSRRPVTAIILAFALSGVLHELLVSVPLWLVYHVNHFG